MSVREPVFCDQRADPEICFDNLCFSGFYGEPRVRSRMTPTSSNTKWRRELQAYGRIPKFRQTIRLPFLVLNMSFFDLITVVSGA
jgi:hypothetical protein